MSLAFDLQNDISLLELLRNADPQDIDGLVNILTDEGDGRLAMSKSSKTALLEAKASRLYDEDVLKLVISELQHFGGNTLVNMIRRDGVAYQKIVRDVASFFGIKTIAKEPAESMEGKILAYLFKKSWEQMSENERARYQETAKGFRPDGTYDLNMLKAILTRVNPANLQHLRVAPDLLKIVLKGAGRVPLVAGGALLQVASTVVAQKHLADISAKLTDIKEGIEKIGEHLKDAREGEITGRLDYLLQIAPYVLNGQSSADVGIRIQLEDCEVKLGAVQNHLEKEIGRLAHRVAKEKDPNLFGTDGLTEILLARQREATPLLEQWNLCMAARMMACHLLSRCEGLHVIAEGRQKTLNRLVQSFLADAGPITTFERAMHNRINGLSSFTDSKMTVHANRIRLSTWKKQKLPSFTEAIGTTCRMVDQLTSEHSRPQLIELDVKVENGRVVEAYSPLVQRTFI
ncbi:hypothetical protein AO067_04335 [Pseudomonas viridiflava ICMP 13104]|uniref:Uncharacterized protein n=1 Tax=Pseudomonas viridiflava ICMP 13104 TaxID=1198305 RepID=A0A0W0HRI9_PSEVI|nr:hypothetical protein AO067_04335 [Pseudomonas viridiflava ICMP 13104]